MWFALIIIGSTIIGFCLGGFLCSILNRQHRRNRQRKQSEQVFWYINEIDIDNLDIRRSPVGGFHISYLNAFAKGEIAPTVASGDGGGTREIEPSPKRPFQANIFANKLERKRHKQSPKSQSQRISMAYPSDQVGRDAKRKMFDNRAFVARI